MKNEKITKKFELMRYFDTYPDGVQGLFNEEDRAKKTKENLERAAGPKTKYRINTIYFINGKKVKSNSIEEKLLRRQDD